MDAAYTAPVQVNRYRNFALIIGIVGVLLGAVGYVTDKSDGKSLFFRSYLLGFVFWVGISLGCFLILMIQHLANGAWGIAVRRITESATRTFWLGLILFIPIALGLHSLYIWSHPDVVAQSAMLTKKSGYLNTTLFIIRSVVYFAIWLVIAFLLNKWSREQDESSDPYEEKRKMRNLSGPALPFVMIIMTFASVDWLMSLDPYWTSTIFGILFMGGQSLSAMAFVIILVILLAQYEPMADAIGKRHLNDLGKLMFAFTLLWAYFAFSQFLIIWAGNLPEENHWYINRLTGGWRVMAGAIVLLHFAVPFALLVSRKANRNKRILISAAILMFVMRYVDTYWWIGPPEGSKLFQFNWMDIVIPLGIGGIWLWYFFTQLKRWPILPVNEPKLEEWTGDVHGFH